MDLHSYQRYDAPHPKTPRDRIGILQGTFVVHNTERVFSALAIAQAHEQNNTLIKADGGVLMIILH